MKLVPPCLHQLSVLVRQLLRLGTAFAGIALGLVFLATGVFMVLEFLGKGPPP